MLVLKYEIKHVDISYDVNIPDKNKYNQHVY